MKKIFVLAAAMFCLSGLMFAQTFGETMEQFDKSIQQTSEKIIPEDQHVTNKTAKVELEYWPGTDELRLYYTCHAVSFDQGEAMNTAMAVFKDFVEAHQPPYYSYKYMKREKVKYFKDEKSGFNWAMYTAYVKLTK